jgi:DNA-directed RNA polymerase specialized sigma24 family protein
LGSRRIHKLEPAADREKVFLDHYEWLLGRALQLSHGAQSAAEDLVHDCYVRFIQAATDIQLDDENRLRGYLYRTLQRLAKSNHESGGRDIFQSLQAVDYDSMEFALASVDRSRLLYIRSDLARICEYCCLRRKTSRAGSVLIFRFFLNYYPSEIVPLLKASSAAVYKLTETGRLEAKAFLTRPESLHFLGSSNRPATPFSRRHLPESPSALFAELNRRIFAEPEGPCFAPGRLELLYASNSKEQLTTQEVAHLASCKACLERANHLLRLLGLPLHFSDDFNEPKDGKPSRPSSGSKQEPLTRMRKKVRDIHEHRPKRLELVVDGEVHGAQQITSAKSRFQIKLTSASLPSFIEVRSEQKLRLLCLDVENYDVMESTELQAEATLSDNRALALELNLGSGSPIVDVSYYDPLLEVVDEDWAYDEELRPPVFPETRLPAAPHEMPGLLKRLKRTLWAWLSKIDLGWPLSVVGAAAFMSLVALSMFWASRSRQSFPAQLQAAALLTESQHRADAAIPVHGAAHRTFSLEIRSQDGRLIQSGTVETLRSTSPRRTAARLLDAKGNLLAGRWESAAGKMTIYTAESGVQHPSGDAQPLTRADAWVHVPEAGDFDSLSGDSNNLKVRREPDSFDVTYKNSETAGGNKATLVSADLVVAANSMRPVRETLLLKDGETTREYRFRELTYEVLPADKVSDRDFDPDLSSLAGHPTDSLASSTGMGDSAHLALEALQLLDNLGPDVEQIVNLERDPDGTIELNGVFPTVEQKMPVAHIFEALHAGNRLKLGFHASDETVSMLPTAHQISIESLAPVDVDTQRIPFDTELRAGLETEGLSGAQLDERVRQIANDIATRGARLHREAWSTCQIAATDFTADELQRMSIDDQILWLTLLDKHLQSLERQSAGLRSDLNHIRHDPNARLPAPLNAPPQPQNVDQLGRAAILLNHDAEQLDRLLTTGFTLSMSGLPQNINLATATQLTSDLETEEGALRATIERLYRSSRTDVND